MHSIKYLFVSLLIFSGFSGFSQDPTKVFLKWKLKPSEVLTYKTTMDEMDTANYKSFSMDGLFKSLDSTSNSDDIKKMFKQLNKVAEQSNLITYLTEKRRNVIEIEMHMETKGEETTTDTSKEAVTLKNMQAQMLKMTGGVMLRGAIHDDGTIESFYTKTDQKNLISTLFELPGKPVKVGDTWSPDIHFLSMDQNFICDSSYKRNNVKIISIRNNSNEHIVTMKYDIEEYVLGNFISPFDGKPVKTSMKMTHKAIGEFSIEKGRWVSYNGVMSLSSSGIMTSQSTKRISLAAQ